MSREAKDIPPVAHDLGRHVVSHLHHHVQMVGAVPFKSGGQELCRRTRYRQPMTTSRGADAVRVIGVGRPGRPVYLHEDSQLLSGTPCKRCLLNRGQCRHQPSQPRNEPVGPFYMSGNKHWGSCQDRPSPAPDRAAGSLPASSGHTCSTTARNSSDMTSIASLAKRDR